ncbi:MBL fold metallo-hydrolase [Terricaulis sp.]|uniref:MBL fold metallo-hydrolase n=1 Tax=Terricaulis sp. TaxID=2768686 RepID=UPI003783988B
MSTRPVFKNSAFVRAPERLVLRGGRWRQIDLPVRYAVFEHPQAGRCLIDTGYTRRVTEGRRSLPLQIYASALRPRLQDDALPAASPQIDAILLTHLHADHVAALLDYPGARIYANGEGVDHFLQAGATGRVRHGVFRELLPADLRTRIVRFESLPRLAAPLGLGPAHDVFGDGEVLAIPLPGHMRGHTGFVWPKLERPLLYAADAQWLARAVMEDRSPGAPARWIMDDTAADKETRRRIAAFARAGGEVVYCHDPEPVA